MRYIFQICTYKTISPHYYNFFVGDNCTAKKMAVPAVAVLSETVSGVLNKCFSTVYGGNSIFSIFPFVAVLRIRFTLASDRCGIICYPDYPGDDSVCCRVDGFFLIVFSQ